MNKPLILVVEDDAPVRNLRISSADIFFLPIPFVKKSFNTY